MRRCAALTLGLALTLTGCFVQRGGTAVYDAGMRDAGMRADVGTDDAGPGPRDAGTDAPPPPTCGNGSIDPGEECDGTDFGGRTCGSLGAGVGDLACAGCTIDTSGCRTSCGDGRRDPDEECDGTDLAGADCGSLGLVNGSLGCAADCTYNRMACLGCGNGRLEGAEQCDGDDLAGRRCAGGLACSASCAYDISSCTHELAGDGSDGDLIVTTDTVLGPTGPAFAVTRVGASDVAVATDPTGLGVGDEVLIINLQGSSADCGSVGVHEVATISAISGRDITLGGPVSGRYGVGGSNADLTGQRIALQRVPHFSRVEISGGATLRCLPWDGRTGGVIAFRAQTLTIATGSRIAVGGLGYRGGIGWSGDGERHGRRGESTCGNPQDSNTSPNRGGGGGGRFVDPGDGCGQGGGGGGYATAGTSLGFASECTGVGVTGPAANGGGVYGVADLTRIYMGSGGGAGATDDHSDESGSGGRGGGIALIWAGVTSIDGRLGGSGAGGLVPGDATDSGNGGGGAGGTLVLRARALTGSGNVGTTGGPGPAADGSGWNSAGGRGGDGRVRIDFFTAGGAAFGSSAATGFANAIATPDPYSDIFLD